MPAHSTHPEGKARDVISQESPEEIADNGQHYSMILEWDPRDNIYVVTTPELPGCRTHGESWEDAVTNA